MYRTALPLRNLQRLASISISSSLKISRICRRHLSQAAVEHRLFDETPQQAQTISAASSLAGKELSQSLLVGLVPDPRVYARLLISLLNEGNSPQFRRSLDEKPQRIALALKNIKIIHTHIIKLGFQLDGDLGNALVDSYAKCGNLGLALKTFKLLAERDGSAWNSILSAYSRCGLVEEIVHVFRLMWSGNESVNQFTFAMVLSACARLFDLDFAKQLHCNVVKMGFESNSFCEGSLIDVYAKCGSLVDARRVFDRIRGPDMISWTVMISAYIRIGLCEEALEIFLTMKKLGGKPDQVLFVNVITACINLGLLEEACDLFAQMANPNVVAWNVMISGHAQNGYEVEALMLFQEMRSKGIEPTRSTLGSVLSSIANLEAPNHGRQVHSEAIRLGLDSNIYVGSSLINMYAKCGIVDDARKVFDTTYTRNIVLWNAMLGGYAQNKHPNEVLVLFSDMHSHSFPSDEYTYVSVLSACSCLENLDAGRQLHSFIIKSNMEASIFVVNAIVDMYAKSGDLTGARNQFELIQNRDIVSWNAILVGHVHGEDNIEALLIFRRMNSDGVGPDIVSLACVLSACANLQVLEIGKQVHCSTIKMGLESKLYVGSSIVDMYSKCADMESAEKAMAQMPQPSVVARNALIAGYVQNNKTEEALKLFKQMQAEGLKPSEFTFATILPACSGPSRLNIGRQIHCHTMKTGCFYVDDFLRIALLGMYLKSESSEDANKLFWEMPDYNSTVLWTAIISGYAQNNHNEEGLRFFQEMRTFGATPDQATFASVLKACASLAALRDGKEIHGLVIRMGFDSDEYASIALIDMYSKCGDVSASLCIFNEMKNKQDVISWNSMIVGFAKNGYAEDALRLFEKMQQELVKPDDITFLGVLTACSHAGLVSKGCIFFDSMQIKFGIQPRADHYACIVDLLGRGGYLKEAEEFINTLPIEPDAVIWATLLASCRMHRDDIRGRWAAEKIIELEPQNPSPYVLLSNIYAASGNWDGVNMVRKAMRERGVRKLPGCSWIMVGKNTNLFVAGDKFHPKASDIHESLKELTAQMKDDGYVAKLDLVLHDAE